MLDLPATIAKEDKGVFSSTLLRPTSLGTIPPAHCLGVGVLSDVRAMRA
jgi:hypothetical protein